MKAALAVLSAMFALVAGASAIAQPWLAKAGDRSMTLDPAGRYDAAIQAEGLFTVAPAPP